MSAINFDKLVIVDVDGLYGQSIARKARGYNVYCEVVSCNSYEQSIRFAEIKGIIFIGNISICPPEIMIREIPILFICNEIPQMKEVPLTGESTSVGELKSACVLTSAGEQPSAGELPTVGEQPSAGELPTVGEQPPAGEPPSAGELPSGGEQPPAGELPTVGEPPSAGELPTVEEQPPAGEPPSAGEILRVGYAGKAPIYWLRPEMIGVPRGDESLRGFLFDVCGFSGDWKISDFVEWSIRDIKNKVGDKKVLCAMSGGVDSMVCATLVNKAIGGRLTCIFVDHGLLRKDEGDAVEKMCRDEFNMNFIRVNAQERFLGKLKGVVDPEEKRKIIGEEFIRVFEEEARKVGQIEFLAQGTIYPDIIESGDENHSTVKSHHNVGGLPEKMDFEGIIEPLDKLFKDEVRKVGIELGIPGDIVWRQPFPGPGLSVRVIGEVTEGKLAVLREVDAIFRDEIKASGLDRDINQYFAVLTDTLSVGVKDGKRSYGAIIALRAVNTTDYMTANFSHIPYNILANASTRILSEVPSVSRVVYDITNKPPATIEWE